MSDCQLQWHTLPNPFLRNTRSLLFNTEQEEDSSETIIGYVSGRSADIEDIIVGDQSAIILAGAPYIGKTTFTHYLCSSYGKWSWRNELSMLQDQLDLDAIYFVSIDLTSLEKETPGSLLETFQKQCASSIIAAYQKRQQTALQYPSTHTGLYQLLRNTARQHTTSRFFLVLDTIDKLGDQTERDVSVDGRIETKQDKGLALLQQCGAIRMLIDLNDEFPNFGVLLSLEISPCSSVSQQFSLISSHLSYDLARFITMTLKTFTVEDAEQFLQRVPESFGGSWAKRFHALTDKGIFSIEDQAWLLEQAGTHPYILQQFSFCAFYYKQKYAFIHNHWASLEDTEKLQVADMVKERLSTFFANISKRLQETLKESSQTTRDAFNHFFLMSEISPNQIIQEDEWKVLGSELRYILASEGIICYDAMQHIHYPGATLLQYLVKETQERNKHTDFRKTNVPSTHISSLSTSTRGHWVSIDSSQCSSEQISLSVLEYRLLQTLLQYPHGCTEKMLIDAAWGREVERTTFAQRIYHLRQKLKGRCGETEIIENGYRGHYLLNHPEWFHLE